MSIASTQQAMGYVAYTREVDRRCVGCGHRQRNEHWPRDLRCALGVFFVSPNGTCNLFSSPAHAGDRVQIGPTDI